MPPAASSSEKSPAASPPYHPISATASDSGVSDTCGANEWIAISAQSAAAIASGEISRGMNRRSEPRPRES